MKRRAPLQIGVAWSNAAPSFGLLAQQRARPAVVAVLAMGSPTDPTTAPTVETVKVSLRDLGWIENQNVVYEVRWAHGQEDRLPALAQELVALNPDVIWTGVSTTALVAKRATSAIPIVFVNIGDPVGYGLAESLAHPGGNATGVSSLVFDLAPKYVELLQAAVPGLRRVAYLRNPSSVADQRTSMRLQETANSLNLRLVYADVRGAESLDEAFALMRRERVEAVIVGGDIILAILTERINDLVGQYRLPAIYVRRFGQQRNGLMSYGQNVDEGWRLSAKYVDRILRGAKPGELPIEQPTRIELVINLRAAKALGVKIPQSMLLRADEVIE